MAAVAGGELSLGRKASDFGVKIENIHSLDVSPPLLYPGKADCTVQYIDFFGNVVTDIPNEWLMKYTYRTPAKIEVNRKSYEALVAFRFLMLLAI